MVLVDTLAIGGPSAVQLPAAASDNARVIVKDSTGAGAANPITVDGNGSTIDGAASVPVSTNFGVVRLVRDDVAHVWFTV